MLQNIFRNMPPVVKNLLLINVVLMLANFVFSSQQLNLNTILGAYYWGSENFEPYQIITHMFMHDNRGLMHILFNMFALVMFGSQIERVWGPKRFLTYYLICGLGSYVLHNIVTMVEIQPYLEMLSNDQLAIYNETGSVYTNWPEPTHKILFGTENIPLVGASGAIFGLLAAFAWLFPNTELMLLFPPIPIKAKWFVLMYGGLEIYLGYQAFGSQAGGIAHFAHIGGALIGLIMLLIWQKNKTKFY